jgi:hypothetical protein
LLIDSEALSVGSVGEDLSVMVGVEFMGGHAGEPYWNRRTCVVVGIGRTVSFLVRCVIALVVAGIHVKIVGLVGVVDGGLQLQLGEERVRDISKWVISRYLNLVLLFFSLPTDFSPLKLMLNSLVFKSKTLRRRGSCLLQASSYIQVDLA